MKKIALILVIVIGLIASLSTFSFAVDLPLRVVVNGDKISFPDAQPYIDSNGRTQTPARFIGEALGAVVTWDAKEKKAVFLMGSKELVLYISKKEYELNGQIKQMDTAATLKNDRTFVPARYVAEAFGATVKWDDAVKTVYINTVKDTNTNGTEVIAGFTVPKERELSVTIPDDERAEVAFAVNVLSQNVAQQISDLQGCLAQKCDSSTVEQVISYIEQKKDRRDYLAEKFVYDNKSQRCIWIQESRVQDINIYLLNSEISKLYKK